MSVVVLKVDKEKYKRNINREVNILRKIILEIELERLLRDRMFIVQ